MATHIQIIRAQEVIRATPDGVLDRDSGMQALEELAATGAALPLCHYLLDTRKTESTLTVHDCWFLADGLARRTSGFRRKTAVLCPAERKDNAEFFALCAGNRGLNISAFTSFEDAVEWLVSDWADT